MLQCDSTLKTHWEKHKCARWSASPQVVNHHIQGCPWIKVFMSNPWKSSMGNRSDSDLDLSLWVTQWVTRSCGKADFTSLPSLTSALLLLPIHFHSGLRASIIAHHSHHTAANQADHSLVCCLWHFHSPLIIPQCLFFTFAHLHPPFITLLIPICFILIIERNPYIMYIIYLWYI